VHKYQSFIGDRWKEVINDNVMDLMEIGCEDGRWMEMTEDRVQWWALVLAVLNRLSES